MSADKRQQQTVRVQHINRNKTDNTIPHINSMALGFKFPGLKKDSITFIPFHSCLTLSPRKIFMLTK